MSPAEGQRVTSIPDATSTTETTDATDAIAQPATALAKTGQRRRRRSGKVSKRARIGFFVGVAALAVICLAIGWLIHLGRAAAAQLGAVRTDVAELRTTAGTVSPERANLLEADLQSRAAAVRRDTRDPLWRLATLVPDFGNDFRVASGMATVTDSLAQNVLPPLITSSHGLRPEALRRADGSIDLAAVTKLGSATATAVPAIAAAQRNLAGLNQHVHFNALGYARAQLGQQLAGIQTSLGTVNTALNLLPPMLGAKGPRNYFLVFQNLAEARGTGGLMGTWGILHADNGTLTLTKSAPDSELESLPTTQPAATEPGAAADAGFDDTWGDLSPLTDYNTANLSPNFAAAGQLFTEHADSQLGMHFDGVLALDPVTLGALLGPARITLSDGTVVTGSTVAQVTESDLYAKYGEGSQVRKQLLAELAKDAFDQLKADSGATLLKALQTSIGGGHLQLWSADTGEERQLAATDLGGVLPDVPGSFAYAAINNIGPKTDFWLQRTLGYATAACPSLHDSDQTRDSQIDLTLTDRVPAGQADVVAHDQSDPTAPYGRGHDYVAVYGPVGALFSSATLNGAPVDVSTSTEQGHLVMSLPLYEYVGQPQHLVFHLVEPVSHTLSIWRPQPMGQPETVTTGYSACTTN